MICEELESCYLGSCELDQCTRVHLFNSCVHVMQTYCWIYAALFVLSLVDFWCQIVLLIMTASFIVHDLNYGLLPLPWRLFHKAFVYLSVCLSASHQICMKIVPMMYLRTRKNWLFFLVASF